MKKLNLLLFISCYCVISFSQSTTITVNPATTYQTIRGFGGSGSMASGYETYIKGVVDLMGTTIWRFYMDGQDGTTITDINNGTCVFSHWDGGTYGNFMKALKASGVDTIVVTCWSPPACLKYNNSLLCSSIKPEYYDEYGKFMVDWTNDFETKTTQKVYAFNVQNEPLFCEPYSSATLGAQEFGPCMQAMRTAFNNAGLSHVKMHGPEHMGSYSRNSGGNGTGSRYIQELLWNSTYRSILDIYSVHSYTDGITYDLGDAPGWTSLDTAVRKWSKELWMTETDFQGTCDWNMAFDMAKQFYAGLKYGKINAWIYWGMNGNNGMFTGGSPTPRLYSCMHFMRFIRPGYQQIECTEGDADVAAMAFKKGMDYTVVALNLSTTKTKTVTFNDFIGKPAYFDMYRSKSRNTTEIEKCAFAGRFTNNSFDLPPYSVVTLYFKSSEPDVYWGVHPPTDLIASNIADNSFKVSWTPAANWIINCETPYTVNVTGYVVYINGVKKTASGPTTATNYTFNNLTKNTNYTVEIYTRDALYNESVAARIIVTTTCSTSDCGPPPPIDALQNEELKISVSPNPASETVTVELPGENMYSLSIIDMSGNVILQKQARNNDRIDVSSLPKGIYLVIAKGEDKVLKTKIAIE